MWINKLISQNSIKYKVLKGVLWTFLGMLISKGFVMLSFILLARIIDLENYGNLGIIRSTINTFSVVSIVSFGVTANKYIAKYIDVDRVKAQSVFTISRVFVFGISAFIGVFIFFFSDYLSQSIVNNSQLSSAIKVSAFTIFFTSLNGLQNGILSGLEKFKYISVVNIANGLMSLPIIIIGAHYFGFMGVVYSLLIIQISLWLTSFYFTNKSIKEKGLSQQLTYFSKEVKVISMFTLPSLISGIIVPFVIWLSDVMISRVEGGMEEIGLYSAAFNFSIISVTLNNILGQVLYPYIMKDENKGHRQLEFANQVLPFFITLILNIPLIIFARYIGFVYGSDYLNDGFAYSLIFISVSTIIIGHSNGVSRKLASNEKMWWGFFSNSVWGILALVGVYLLKDFGSIGRSLGFTLAYIVNTSFFIPLFIKMKLIERRLIFNKYSVITWGLLIGSTVLSLKLNAVFSSVLLVLSMIILTLVFYKWFINEKHFWNSSTNN